MAAKVAAYLSFVLLFCTDANLVSLFVYPLSAAPFDAPVRVALQYFAAHFVTMTYCTALTIATVSGGYAIVRMLLPNAITLFELIIVALTVAFLFVGPVSLKLLLHYSWARLNPALWFLGLYETLLPFPSPDIIFQNKVIIFGFAALAHQAVIATGISTIIGLFAVLAACRRTDRERRVARSSHSPFPRGWLISQACRLVPVGVPRATAAAYWTTLVRVHECQLALAIFMGTAAGVVLNELSTAGEGSGWFFIAPFVLTFFLVTGLVAITRLQVHLEARWPLLISPDLRAQEVRRGVMWSIAIFALLPVLLILEAAYGSALGYAEAAALLASCGLLALLLLQAVTWNLRIFPFAHEATLAKQNLPLVFVGYALALGAYGFILGHAAGWLLQHHKLAFANAFLLAALLAAHYANARRNPTLEVGFAEVDESEVQLLNIG
jgi:hypothetical protein